MMEKERPGGRIFFVSKIVSTACCRNAALSRPIVLLERAKGIEPSYAAWEAAVLPLNYARDLKDIR
jgi:hypothetical protein